MSTRVDYKSLRDFLEAHPDGAWIMRGGDFAGQVRSAKGLLAESQEVAIMVAGGPSIKVDTLDLPCFERDGVIYQPEGTKVGPFTLPFDVPIMAEEFRV